MLTFVHTKAERQKATCLFILKLPNRPAKSDWAFFMPFKHYKYICNKFTVQIGKIWKKIRKLYICITSYTQSLIIAYFFNLLKFVIILNFNFCLIILLNCVNTIFCIIKIYTKNQTPTFIGVFNYICFTKNN
ncbi:MAG: hypothetical protein CFE23_16345 [Flavobacterium sp. BFFFF1]|nr:MAG: hypothetical protein CFE23_16345 [Flavobacterium sp. BFFFF1]